MVESFLPTNSYNDLKEFYVNSSNTTPPKAAQILNDEFLNATTPPKSRSQSTKGPFSNLPKMSDEYPKQHYSQSINNIRKLISAIKKHQKNLNVLEKAWSQWRKPKNKCRAVLTMSVDSIFHTPPKKDCNDISDITFNSGFFPSLLMNENSEIKWKKGESAKRKLKYAISSSEVRYFYKKKRAFIKYKRLVFDPRYVVVKKPIAKIRILAMKNCFKLFAKCYFKQFCKFKSLYLKHFYYGTAKNSSSCFYIKFRGQSIRLSTKFFIDLLNTVCANQVCRSYWHILQVSNIEKYEKKFENFTRDKKSKILKGSIIHWISTSKELMRRRIFISADNFYAIIEKLHRIRLRKYFIRIITRNLKSLSSILNNFDKKSFLCLSNAFLRWRFHSAMQLQSDKYKQLGALNISKTLILLRVKALSPAYFTLKSIPVKIAYKSYIQKAKLFYKGNRIFVIVLIITILYFCWRLKVHFEI